ncbi:hypothetical protein BDN72DRAFT_961750 [Pluteus cervinus]|uniref:Uncharacterized protein n=1 Tax=Pluteus cervinus TaxID=181527 RepID=A0ACD3AKX7_9AGAR|nr:hypothetical protein BDN72DRAFT_961750 [Pluteus cervinus]
MSSATEIPSAEALERVSELEVDNTKGEKVKFGSLYAEQKVIVVFIRHFFCGACQAYVEKLATVATSDLEATNTKLVVVGCGEWSAIQTYKETTTFQGELYADPSRDVYHALGMDIENMKGTPSNEQRKSYLTLGALSSALMSIWRGPVKNPTLLGKQGNLSQLGGEFVLGPGPTCTFAYRMQHTEDHTEVADLLKAAGVTPT